jgi:hypothetical protein
MSPYNKNGNILVFDGAFTGVATKIMNSVYSKTLAKIQ